MPLPHLLPNILFPELSQTTSTQTTARGGARGVCGYPTSWWGRAGQNRVPDPVAHLGLWQTHLIPGKDTPVKSWSPSESHKRYETANTRRAPEALHPGTL